MNGGAGDTMVFRQLAQAVSAFAVPQDGSVIKLKRFAPDVAAFEAGAAHAGAYPLDDQVALELGDRSDDDDNGASQWAARIDRSAHGN
jgi:precorrin-3B methylase